MLKPTRYFPHKLLGLLVAVLLGFASAASPSFGVSISPFTGGWPALTGTASLPFVTLESSEGPVVLSGRLDLSAPLGFSSPPSVGLAATATFTSLDLLQPYFGAGAALGWYGSGSARAAFVTPTLLAGVRVPFHDIWAARVEVAAAPFVGGASLSLGLEVSPW